MTSGILKRSPWRDRPSSLANCILWRQVRQIGTRAMESRLNQSMKQFRRAWVTLSLIAVLPISQQAAAGASEGQYKLLTLYSTEAVQFLKLGGKPDDRVTCISGVLNTSQGASSDYIFSETTIVCQRGQDKASAHWNIHTQECGIGLAAEGHSFEVDSQNIFAADCVYVDVSDQSAEEDFEWECATYMSLTQPFRVQFPAGARLDECIDVLVSVNLSKFKNIVTLEMSR